MATAEKNTPATTTPPANLPAISAPRLPYHPLFEKKFGITYDHWRALVTAIYPNAKSTDAILLAMTYCKSRGLDIFKRPVHIVAIWSEAEKRMIDSVWPGIGELRTTAHRTGKYSGRDETKFGPDVTEKVGEVSTTYPAWAQVTVYRIVEGNRVAFHGPRVRWLETYAVRKRGDSSPNQMWADRPYGQLEKCAEAAALRMAFPEEVGEYIVDEVEHHASPITIDAASKPAKQTLETLAERFSEKPYESGSGNAPTDDAHQGDHIEDVDQSEAPDPLAELAEAHPLFGLPTMLKAACEAGSLEKINTAEGSYTPMGTEPEIVAQAKRLCEVARDMVRSKRGGRSNK